MKHTEAQKDDIMSGIFTLISSGLGSVKACEREGISPSTYYEWLSKSDKYAYAHAKAMECRSEILFDEIIDIADESNVDVSIGFDGEAKIDGEAIQRSKLKIDARKWMLGKMMPKKYGDKIDVTSDGNAMKAPVIIVKQSDDE